MDEGGKSSWGFGVQSRYPGCKGNRENLSDVGLPQTERALKNISHEVELKEPEVKIGRLRRGQGYKLSTCVMSQF